jgi:pantothenate kinase-related protein Tda10
MVHQINPFNIQLIEPKDHFFDSEDRAERKHAKRKNATITKLGAPCKGIKPIRPSVQRRKNIPVVSEENIKIQKVNSGRTDAQW